MKYENPRDPEPYWNVTVGGWFDGVCGVDSDTRSNPMSKDIQFLVIAGETTKNNNTYIDRIVGIYQQWPSARRAAKRVNGVVKAVPYYDGRRTIK